MLGGYRQFLRHCISLLFKRLGLSLIILLGGCATSFSARVSTTHNWPPDDLPNALSLPYRFAVGAEQKAGLEQQIAQFLGLQFWDLQTGDQAHQAILEINPDLTQTLRERIVREPYQIPISVPVKNSSGQISYMTQWVYGGMRERIVREYELRLRLDIYSIKDLKVGVRQPIWTGEAMHITLNPNAASHIPDLLEILFRDFPGESGNSQTVTIQHEK